MNPSNTVSRDITLFLAKDKESSINYDIDSGTYIYREDIQLEGDIWKKSLSEKILYEI